MSERPASAASQEPPVADRDGAESEPPSDDGEKLGGAADPTPPGKPKGRTRRIVLKAAGGLLAAGAVGAVGYGVYDRRQRFGRDAVRTIRDHRVALPSGHPAMVVARGGTPAKNARAALERLGGMKQFVTPDDVVVVKPNIGWDSTPAQGANTHPDVVVEVVKACLDARAKRVIVTDCPVQKATAAFEKSGILRAARAAGAEVVLPAESQFLTVKLSERLGAWGVLEPFVEATKIINVPIGKHHDFTGVTGGMKNWIGITLERRMSFHGDIDRSIAELAALMLPTLTVMDASRVLMRNGPRGGNLADVKEFGALAAGTDPVALDAWACGLLDKPDEKLPGYLRLGEEAGLGRVNYRSLDPIELTVG
ncbi:MAG: DUF362 domain-containing protein [Deltaproteobacteria bacterium]|jgi:uncharacterized protein (DUF362 family)|nr:DUF362 domain-containing protein [Deltaproteobacteria bacterium]MBW2534415.1 DUF362 domain-containing protein [Deltaproteobacteria bacterium]